MTRLLLIAVFAAVLSTICFAQNAPRWFKGNTHTHTSNSDGDSAPEVVVKWYAENGYNFLFITDHEFITRESPLNERFGKPQQFLVIEGQEVTDSVNKKPYHMNGLGISSVVMPQKGPSPVESLQSNIDRVIGAGGVGQLNHPNFGWALTAAEIRQLRGLTMMEIYNGHPLVNNLGGGGSPSAEEIWDQLLSSGMKIYGAGTDDSHHFREPGNRLPLGPGQLPIYATPGQAWIYVRAAQLNKADILDSIRKGDFYASTGVELEKLETSADKISIAVKPQSWSRYRIDFIGKNGRVLRSFPTASAEYKIRGNEGYVRAKVFESNGAMAWTQPVFANAKIR
jgi:hypothetical protein